ncbi:hypothetical protein E2562_004249 [Oryza meyeriana var. granulata]|uniref:Uncharacterized protein n=1 Tax=Oryza meyeriana var. granulata TaxID=110450 RepID=A0A6G1BSN5_9ORYZ|nr:hypothetical protein E2562_004249 [Oryza meyeriana var. granulata]
MKELAENFEVSQKVGFADICDGSPSQYAHAENTGERVHPTETGLCLKSLDVQQRTIHYDLAAQKNHMVEAFSGSIAQQEYASNAAESSKQQENDPFLLQPNTYGAHRTNDTDDLPEFDFANLHRVEMQYDVHPLNRETIKASFLGVLLLYRQIKASFLGIVLHLQINAHFLGVLLLYSQDT